MRQRSSLVAVKRVDNEIARYTEEDRIVEHVEHPIAAHAVAVEENNADPSKDGSSTGEDHYDYAKLHQADPLGMRMQFWSEDRPAMQATVQENGSKEAAHAQAHE